jgi:hypothetical protein
MESFFYHFWNRKHEIFNPEKTRKTNRDTATQLLACHLARVVNRRAKSGNRKEDRVRAPIKNMRNG